jgi:hypothetical protein
MKTNPTQLFKQLGLCLTLMFCFSLVYASNTSDLSTTPTNVDELTITANEYTASNMATISIFNCPPTTTDFCGITPPPFTTTAEFVAAGGVLSSSCTISSFSMTGQTVTGTCPTTITRTYTLTDCNDTETCTHTIIVSSPPSAVCQNITVELDSTGMASWTLADLDGGSGGCDLSISQNTFTCINTDTATCASIEVVLSVTLNATGSCGTSTTISTCSATVTVEDNTPPMIVCPANISVNCGAPNDPTVTGEATATDNSEACGGTVPIMITSADAFTPGCGNSGLIERTWTATDVCGNMAVCTQEITVTDIINVTNCPASPPTINGCSSDDVFPTSMLPFTLVDSTITLSQFMAEGGSANDDCSSGVITYSDSESGSCPTTVTRTFTVTDGCANATNCIQVFSIDDTTFPTIAPCPPTRTVDGCSTTDITNDPNVNQPFSTGFALVSSNGFAMEGGGWSDNCNPQSMIQYRDTSTGVCPIVVTRTWFVTDICGNTTTCAQTININDTTNPTPVCNNISVTLDAVTGLYTLTPSDEALIAIGSTDNCSLTNTTITPTMFDCDDVGPNVVTMILEDQCGNIDSCTATVTVVSSSACCSFEATCPTVSDLGDFDCTQLGNIPASPTTAAEAAAPPYNITIGATPCGTIVVLSIDNIDPPYDVCTVGGQAVTRTVTVFDDLNANGALDAGEDFQDCVYTFDIIEDITPPTITCPANVTVGCQDSTDPMDTGEATATDNCTGGGAAPATLWINEFHYDNTGTDTGEFVEVAGTAGYDLSTCSIVLYNGNGGASYNTVALSGIMDDEGMGYGAQSVAISGIQNGAPDGIALVCGGAVLHFISYEGSFTATNGPAVGMTSTDVGVSEPSSTPIGQSLQLVGSGNVVADFTWAGPSSTSSADLNTNQTIIPPAPPTGPSITFVDASTPDVCAQYIISRTWTASDACGNMATCTQMITVEGPADPVITCPANLTIECDESTAPANTGTATATADCGLTVGVAFTDASTQGTAGCPQYEYEITRTWTATDQCGNMAVCTQIIMVEDNTPPVITCPANVTVECDASTDPADTGEATAVDNCSTSSSGAPTPTIWINEFHYDNAGTDTGEFVEVAGTAGFDLSTCSVVLYNGNGGASYSTIPLSGMIDDEGMGYGAVSFAQAGIQNGAPDGLALVCGGVVLEFLSYEGSFMATNGPALGMTSTDVGVAEGGGTMPGESLQLEGTGNMAADFTWTGPTVASPGDLNNNQTVATPGAGETIITFNDVSNQGQGCSANSYTITRTWTATDACSNMTNCVQTITVVDTTPPVITCPANVTVECDQPTDPSATGMASAIDNCDGSSGGDPIVWINEFHYDNTGTDTGEFIEIGGTAGFDLSTCNVVLYNGNGGASYNTLILSGMIDNESNGFGAVDFAIAGIQNGSPDGLALVCNGVVIEFLSYEGSFMATNGPAAGMTSTDVGVSEPGATPVGQSLQLEGTGMMSSDFTWAGPITATPGSLNANQTILVSTPGDVTITFTDVSTQTPTGCTNDSYTISRTWTATDACNNMATCTQVITIVDTTPPTITCPDNITIECDEDTSPANTGSATAVDNCTPVNDIAITFADVSTQATSGCGQYQYEITRTWTATDPCGNNTACTQTITVEDTTPPAITCPADVSLSCTDNTDPASTGTATGTDNCSTTAEVVISFTDISSEEGEGCGQFTYTILRTWLATDACDNTTTCVQTIEVADTEPPVITCPPSQILTCFETVSPPHMTAADFIAAGGTISDNCTTELSDFTVFSQDDDNGGDNCPGNAREVVRTYFVADACGNTSTCEQTFTYLESTTGPVITSILPTCFKYCASLANPMETDITYTTDCSFGATVSITGPTQIGQDNCPGSIYRYTYTVTDDCGRTSAPVTRDFVIGNDGPTIECAPFNLILECGDPNSQDYIDAHIATVTANSSCEVDVNINHFPQSFNLIACGSATVVTFVATDACGRTASCTTTVAIQDNTAPEITSTYIDGVCNEAICGSDVNFFFNTWKAKVLEGLSATDGCDSNVSFTVSGPNSANQDCPDGTAETVLTWVANDNCGNTSGISYSFYVVLADEPSASPSIMGMVATEQTETVENVSVTLVGNAVNLVDITTADGMYGFENLVAGQNYSVTPFLDENPLNGVSSFDLVLISKHILQLQALDSPYKIIAADVNNSGSVTTMDMVALRKLILHIDDDFANNTSWRFVEAAYVFPVPTNPFASIFPEEVYINGLTAEEQHDFVGVKIGDVNGSAVANAMAGADDRTFVDDLVFNVADQELKAGESYEVTFKAENFAAIHGYQFTLNFDQSALEFVSVNAGELNNLNDNNFGLRLLEEGVITTSWTSQKRQSLISGTSLFHVRFIAKVDVLLSEVVSIGSRYTIAEAYNGNLELMDVQLRFEDGAIVTNQFQLYQNRPNPFMHETLIGFYLPKEGPVTLTVFDQSGRELKRITANYLKGYNTIILSKDDLDASDGLLLYYQVETENTIETKKMILN